MSPSLPRYPNTHTPSLRSVICRLTLKAMALLRLPCYSSTPYFSTEHYQIIHATPPLLFLHKSFNPSNHIIISTKNNFSLSWSLSHPLSHTHRINRNGHLVLHSTSTTQDPVVGSSSLDDAEGEEEEEGEGKEEGYSQTRLCAMNVPWTSTAEDIRALFEKFGAVLDVEVSMYNKTRNRGLAFVTMASPQEALAALKNLEHYELEGRALKMNYAKIKKKKDSPAPSPKPAPTFNLFVANLPFDARAKDLREFLIAEGASVASVEIIFHDNPRRSSGYGFIGFKTKKEADEALSAFQGKAFKGRPLRVARSRQFVREQRKESLQSNDTSTELNTGAVQADETVDN